ncbi:hypothetical protein [Streptomyces sp. RB17]|nr:hypothetical protein [Streptomyces sp. RB17]
MSDTLRGPTAGKPTSGVVLLRVPGWSTDALSGPITSQSADAIV